MSNAIAGLGTKVYRWNPTPASSASGGAWEKIAEVTELDGPNKTRETIDVTNLDSENYREFIGSIRDGGEVSLSMNFTNASYRLMNDDFENNARQNYKIVLPDAFDSTLEFAGLVTSLSLTATVDDKVSADTTIKVSGEPLFSDNQSSV